MKIIFFSIFIVFILVLIHSFTKNPFSYPCYEHDFDVSGKRNPSMDDYIDNFIINGNFDAIEQHNEYVQDWIENSKKKIKHTLLFKRHRRKQFESVINDNSQYKFVFYRSQRRYHQVNYKKQPYDVKVMVESFNCSFNYLKERARKLQEINYSCTLNEYFIKDQRKLMTKELREAIMKRDNYTCCICGKYMPDKVGLHIDHIIPVSKGGRSIPENLQTTCDRCNLAKSNKTRRRA